MDYNATTPTRHEARVVAERVLRDCYGNPSSVHFAGRQAKKVLDESREKLAAALGARASEIVFTGGGTESDNTAIKGVASRHGRGHIVTSVIEHPAVLETCRSLETEGFDVTYVTVDTAGRIDPEEVRDAIRSDTILISIMWANNETGVVQPVAAIGEIARERGVVFFSDAVQAFARLPVDVREARVDMLSISGHKLYAPKGIGALYVRKGVELVPLAHGGGHERGRRSGTENVAGIAALGEAARLACEEREPESERLRVLRDRLEDGVLKAVPGTSVNGAGTGRISNTANIRFEAADGEAIVYGLDEQRIAVSSASACAASHTEPSYVLTAMGLSRREAEDSVRFSLGRYSDATDVERCLEVLPAVVDRVRSLDRAAG